MYLKVLLVTLIFLALAFLALGISILIKKNGKFPQISVGKNKDMHKKGISCVKHDELKCHHQEKRKKGEHCACGEAI